MDRRTTEGPLSLRERDRERGKIIKSTDLLSPHPNLSNRDRKMIRKN
jgi:hypothetical protein